MESNRLLYKIIEKRIQDKGAVLLYGPHNVGKTQIAHSFIKSSVSLSSTEDIELAKINDKFLFNGATPRLIDEWQYVPDIWNKIQNLINVKNIPSQFVLTGSSEPEDKNKIFHSEESFIDKIKIKTLTLTETNESKKIISIKNIFSETKKNIFFDNKNYSIEDTAFYICRGGWPKALDDNKDISLNYSRNIYKKLFEFKNLKNGKYRNKKKNIFYLILSAYARNISTENSNNAIINDIKENNNKNIDIKTFNEYVEALRDLYIIEDIEAFIPPLKNQVTIRKANTRHFYETSIAAKSLDITPDFLMNNIATFTKFFKDFCIKELSVYTQILNGKITHYKDANNLECDCIIELENGDFGLINFTLGSSDGIENSARSLKQLEKKIDYKKFKKPSFKMIITAFGETYIRKDNILVTSINCITL